MQMIGCTQKLLQKVHLAPDAEIFQVLNHTPFKAISYNYPEEKMREMLSEVQT